MMKAICKLTIFCAAVLLVNATALQAQTKPEKVFNPPEWIIGEWANLGGGASPDNIETIIFSADEIELKQGLADALTPLSRKYKKAKVQEKVEGDIYRLTISSGKDETIYEFKYCSRDRCSLNSGEALTYSITRNKKVIRMHSTSIQNVLMRGIRSGNLQQETIPLFAAM